MLFRRALILLLGFSWLMVPAAPVCGAELQVHEFTSEVLRGNPLGDPVTRRLAVFVPDNSKSDAPMGLIIYLPGWGGSSEDAIAHGRRGWLGGVIDELAAKGLSFRLAVVDGRSRFGGSQFLNSTATGRYADYVVDEVAPFLAHQYQTKVGSNLIAGHSSGAYGALMLASSHQKQFSAVVALSPDSDFETTHKPLVTQSSVQAVTAAELESAVAPIGTFRMPSQGLAELVMGLCANYAPISASPGHFEWLYDSDGRWRQSAWDRWLELDPLTVVKSRPDAFSPTQHVYLDGAEHDEFGANIGAGKIYEVLRTRPAPVLFYQSPGHHSDHLGERLLRGVLWATAP